MVRALRAAGLHPARHQHPQAAWRALIEQFPDSGQLVRTLRAWQSLAAAVAQRCLAERGFCPTLIAGRQPGFDLPAQLAELNGWHHFQALRELPAAPQSWQEDVAAYENIRPRDQNRTRALVDHFLFWLGGIRWQ